jgi:hypothetical protein
MINDGYLMNSLIGRRALVDRSASPLRALAECGYVTVLSRSDDLAETPEKMQKDVPSFRQLLRDKKDWSALRQQLSDATEQLRLWRALDPMFAALS